MDPELTWFVMSYSYGKAALIPATLIITPLSESPETRELEDWCTHATHHISKCPKHAAFMEDPFLAH